MATDSQAKAIIGGTHQDPFAYLGPHLLADGRCLVRAFLPRARQVEVLDHASGQRIPAAAVNGGEASEGIYEVVLDQFPQGLYRLRVDWGTKPFDMIDPYQFGPWLGETDLYLFREGTHLSLPERLGAHVVSVSGVAGVVFVVWAPNANRVSVVGDFNGWDGRRHPMRRHPGAGLWELFIPGLADAERYKYELLDASNALLPLKADPVAAAAERPPATASLVHGGGPFSWSDASWRESRPAHEPYTNPMTIYEVHLGSWRRRPEDGDRYLTYHELTKTLVPYVKDMGFTHIELLPITEYPFDGSWGYQPIGMFAPTSRFGSPDDFRAFVDTCHGAGLGVILDWVAGHFPNDPHGLAAFDGTKLYEHADPRLGLHKDWNTLIYNYGRTEVAEFLLNSALNWIERFHLDGLRVDAVASMLYLDYSRAFGEWIPNRFGGRENLEAVAFLKRMNETLYARCPGSFTIAEESTAWPLVSRPTYDGGLGFGFKWNMGWMHDTLQYMALDPISRSYHHEKLTFGLLYAFDENFVLPLSHDEVVHGKGSILSKMPGDRWQKFANVRAYYAFMYAHPGKKLLFMGGEFAQEREWNHDRSLDWHLLDDAMHRGVRDLVRDLNSLLRRYRPLHELDHDRAGFDWIDASDRSASTLAFIRYGRRREDHLLAVVNFTPVVRQGYRIGVPDSCDYEVIFNSDDARYGGSGVGDREPLPARAPPWHGRAQSIALTVPPLAAVFLAPRRG
jgi:1,4-alpha-glucan branching enzyme